MTARVRVVAWTVVPVLMVDDGDNLTPLPLQPLEIPAAQWQAFKDGGDEAALAQVREQVETPQQHTNQGDTNGTL